jgi:hypothetical protein
MTDTKTLVLNHLQNEKIKLWLPPYRKLPTDDGGGANNNALNELAQTIQEVSYLPLRRVHTIFYLALIFVSCDTLLNTTYVHVGID